MTFPILLERLVAAGIRLRNGDGELRVAGNRAALTPELVEQLRAHKAALLQMLEERGDEWWAPAAPDAASGDDPSRGELVYALFAAQAARRPHAVAVVHEGGELTYGELDRESNRLAHHLRARGVGPDARVAVCLERSPELVVALLAVLKAGGAYVPLDPAYPAERVRFTLGDAAPVLVLTRDSLAAPFRASGVPTVGVDADAHLWAGRPESGPEIRGHDPAHAAYVIYTSGSTGIPKGVVVPHAALCRQVAAVLAEFGLGPQDRSLQFASVTFDASVEEIFGALCAGATLVLRGEAWIEGAAAFWERCAAHGVGVVDLPTRFWQLLAREPSVPVPPCVRLVVTGGEAMDAEALAAWFARPGHRPRLLNSYGPTETTVNATFHEPAGAAAWRCIGRVVAGTRAYVLDGGGEPVPVGVAGELFLGGGQLARGYLGRPGLTADRFVPDPFSGGAGARMYRTGDVVRWSAQGELEFLGRNDDQVKIRGFRIELGEVEARLAEHPRVREAAVLAREDASGERRLVAYVVAEGAEAPGPDVLRRHLAEVLPGYMVPAAFVRLEALPLTPGGKLDRRALPAPEGDAFATRGYEAPVGEVEVALAEIWAELLGVERVGRSDHFFELGGHSLLAVQVVSRVRRVLGAEVALGEVFAHPVLADLARAVAHAPRAELPPIEPADRTKPLALSFAQQRLWFLERMGGLGSTYHIPVRMRLRGELDGNALRRALDAVVARHEALRTTFVEVGGEAVQRIAPVEGSRFALAEHDLTSHPEAVGELRRIVVEEAQAPFDLARGPLFRGRLVRLADDDHVLLLTLHHIVADGWSMGVLTRELGALYDAFRRGEADPLPPLPIQYADYAAWQRRWVDGEVLQTQAEFWTRTLDGAPELLELPTDRPRPAVQDFAGAVLALELNEELTAGVKALGSKHGTTPFQTLLAAWAIVLARLSGQDDVVVGTPVAGRNREETEGLVGFFVNTLALRIDLSSSPTVAELLERVRTRTLQAQQHQDIPFEQVVELVRPARSLAHSPLFQVMFAWQNEARGGLELSGLTPAGLPGDGVAAQVTAKFDLSLTLSERRGRIVGGAEFAAALFDRETVERHLGYLRRVLEEMVADDTRGVDRLAMLPEAEYRQVVQEWNGTASTYPADACIHELFAAQAARTPRAVAVVCGEESLGYAELNARANRLAYHLRGLGVGPDARVAVCAERSVELVVALLAVLKAGGAYVPLDPAYPQERLRYLLGDSAPAALLTQGALRERMNGLAPEVPVVLLDGEPAWTAAPEMAPVVPGLSAGHPAYVIYTSGSTGQPKGVAVAHRNLAHLVGWHRAAFALEAGQRSSSVAGLGFDAAAWEIWPPLCTGGTLVLPRGAPDPEALLTWWAGERLDVSFLPTPLAELALARGRAPTGLRLLLTGGDRLRAVAPAHAPFVLVNNYGPTEATVVATSGVVEGAGTPHIGGPIANARVYVLDVHGEPVPVGVAGELYVGGAGVAIGYTGRPALTAERFVPDPFAADGGARLYRTGDLARWLPDGTIDFLGRTDAQVKVRGFRIEPGEVEAALLRHPAVRETAVVSREEANGGVRLVAFWVGAAEVDAEALRAHLRTQLPEHMVPAAFVRLAALPLTPNGKLDRRALPAAAEAEDGAYLAPRTAVEDVLTGIWAEVLRVERVGVHDNFFERGGHSLLVTRLLARVRAVFGVDVPLRALFEAPTVEGLAQVLARRDGAPGGPAAIVRIVPTSPGEPGPVSRSTHSLELLPLAP